MTAKHLFSSTQVERLANRMAADACQNRPSALTPYESGVVIALLRVEFDRMEAEAFKKAWPDNGQQPLEPKS